MPSFALKSADRSHRRGLVSILLCAVLAVSARGADDPPGQQPQYRQVVDSLKRWDEFWTSMRLHFVLRSGRGNKATEDSVEWIRGDLGAQKVHVVTTSNGAMKNRQLFLMVNGRGITLSYPPGESVLNQPRSAVVTNGRAENLPIIPGPLFSLQDPMGRSLAEWIQQREVAVQEPATIDGEESLVWDVLSRRPGFPSRRLVFAPRFGCLMRSQESFSGVNRVYEYREMAPGIWFPWSGQFRPMSGEPIQWEVQKLEFNEVIPDEEFSPPLEVGTPIEDRSEGRKYRYEIPDPDEQPIPASSFDWLLQEVYRGRHLLVLLAVIPIIVLLSRGLRRAVS